ncbi:MAG TPA: hypothetical protein VFK28_12640 [Sphingomicrobium sp.]|nr:hypothetical protein [Sphingomicrobium sp.]
MIAAALMLAATAAPSGPCELSTGWSEIAAKNARFLVFGEEHGTRESPELVGSIVCALASSGRHVLVGVELSSSGNSTLQQLWDSPTEGFAQRLQDRLPDFAHRQDGVGSEAMLHMLERLHALTRAGMKIDVVAFNSDPAQEKRWAELPGQGAHEAGQAANIAAAAEKKNYDDILILVGNAHAQKKPIEFRDSTYKPMAMQLARAGPVLSLDETFGSGTAWNCIVKPRADRRSGEPISQSDIDCGSHETGMASADSVQPKAQIGLWSTAPTALRPTDTADWRSGYDGYYWFPVVHASPPVGTGASR